THLQAQEVPRREAEARLGLDADLVGAPEEIEVVHVERAEERLQRSEDAGERDAERLRLHPIDVGEELGHAGAEGRVEGREPRLGTAVAQELVDHLLESDEADPAAVLELYLEA